MHDKITTLSKRGFGLKQVFTIVLLAVVLGGLIFINRALAGRHFVVSGAPGELIFAESFDQPDNWGLYDDGQLSAEAVDGTLRMSVNAVNSGAFSSAAAHFGDLDLRVDAAAVDGPIDNAFGLIFGLQNQDNNRISDDSYFLFQISSDGYYRMTRTDSGQERILSNWIQSEFVHSEIGAANRLRVTAHNGLLQFYVNDQLMQLCIPDDPAGISTYYPSLGCVDGQMFDGLEGSSYTGGRVGVVAQSTAAGGSGVTVDFNNLVVFVPKVAS